MAVTSIFTETYFLKTSGNTIVYDVYTTLPVGTVIAICVAADNLSATTPTFTASDTQSNPYTVAFQDARQATAGAGVACAFIYSELTNELVNGDVITVTLSSNVTARAGHAIGFSGLTGNLVGNVVSSEGSGTTISLTSESAASGDLVFAFVSYEGSALPTGDSDTTNGSWTIEGVANTSGGSAVTNVLSLTQYKITTGAGTQTYDATIPSTDWIAGVVVFEAEAGGGGPLGIDLGYWGIKAF